MELVETVAMVTDYDSLRIKSNPGASDLEHDRRQIPRLDWIEYMCAIWQPAPLP